MKTLKEKGNIVYGSRPLKVEGSCEVLDYWFLSPNGTEECYVTRQKRAARKTSILVKNPETFVCVSPFPVLIWVLQSSQCFKIIVASILGKERGTFE